MNGYPISPSLADYFGVDRSIEKFIPELLADFYDLGGFPDQIVELLRPLGSADDTPRVLDLACGKGAVSIALAAELGFECAGIDLLPPFVEEARANARRQGVADLCRFEHGDIREVVGQRRGYDAVLLISVGYVLGGIGATVGALRRMVKQGGYLVIDDAYLRPGVAVDFPGYEHCLGRAEMLAELTVHGDTIVTEHRTPLEHTRAQNRRYMSWIENRAERLAREHPEHAHAFAAYVARERAEIEIIEHGVVCATWVLETPK